jgi:HD-GYP domain-containing protein (c-di-GMP phosphodiesterase class II)
MCRGFPNVVGDMVMVTVGAAEKAREIYISLFDYLKDVKVKVATKRPVDIEPAYHLVKTLVDEPILIQSIFPLTLKKTTEKDYMVTHQANVAVSALKLSLSLEYTRLQLLDLGVVSLIHDLGLWSVPDAILNKVDPLTAAEFNMIRDHSKIGRDILAPFEQERPWLPEVVYQHHERGNGMGYPQGLRMDEMHNYSLLISFLDAYEAMLHHRPQRRGLKQTFATGELIAGFKESSFPADIIKAFLKEITLYPEGCHVLLNNEWVCEVIMINRSNPLRPDVRVVIDHLGRKVCEDKIIRLIEFPMYNIIDSVSQDEIPY